MKIKNLLSSAVFAFFISLIASAQVPQGISHQAVIRDASNNLVTNSAIGVKVSILQGSANGPVAYSETHALQSNANGLISFVIGEGTVVSGVFAEIDWTDVPYFVKTEADPAGGSNYSITGVSEMFSVPYAFVAKSAKSLKLPVVLESESGQFYTLNIDAGGNLFTTAGQPCPGSPTVTDVDGNIYNTVLIGNQCWMKENLKTTKYNNNTPIEYPGSDNSAWQNNTTGAYAWYDNDIAWKDSYGTLYNWYAVSNANGLCPTGWHVPTDDEFTDLTDHLGGTSVAGGKMKSTRTEPDPHPRWESPNTGATNESGWSGLPGGTRSSNGSFTSFGSYSSWWSATEYSAFNAWLRFLYYEDGDVYRFNGTKTIGFSVRCVRD